MGLLTGNVQKQKLHIVTSRLRVFYIYLYKTAIFTALRPMTITYICFLHNV